MKDEASRTSKIFSSTSPRNTMFSPNSVKDDAIKTRLGMTEQMEKYISHDLGLIQEE